MAHEKKQLADPIDIEKGYETEDLSIRGMVIAGVSVGVVILIVSGVILLLFTQFNNMAEARREPLPPLLRGVESVPPVPRIQREPAAEYEELRAFEDGVLNSYGWVDEETGTVRIPVEQAKELLLERGLPTRPQDNEAEQ